ncbi:MFS transporter [Waterburya agarophytonicola K14]|uniref:MFS transporter n=1 Tax=Waterburya agarophytonicola KI4 TaxID=2874699 RepID=A0A964BQB3_9CYAN|nr:MFS transporter [Waterburya agarophytonicola]MCC0176856.1 MFS transporter [Waterburya agarophytonicola KI4]
MSIPQPADIPEILSKPKFSFWQLWNMNFGFLGIQFGWGLQMANMSAIFEYLGADADRLPILWLAAPLTGLLVQPIVGNLSDYTWTFLGRRRPYFLVGAILACIALFAMPNCSNLWIAAGLLWILDTSANVSMVPFRAFVGDLLPREQRTQGFAMQSIMLGLGAVSASALPWILSHIFQVDNTSNSLRKIPLTIEVSFYIGAILFLGTVLWTVVTTPEYPPQNLAKFEQLQAARGGISSSLREIWQTLGDIPPKMQQLAKVQFFTWLGIFCFLLYFPPAVARNIFGATSQNSLLYSEGIEWAGICFALYNAVCIGFSFLLPRLAGRFGRPAIHSFSLFCGGISLISLLFITNRYILLLAMIGLGIAWASALIMPYAMLTNSIPPQRRGIYQGIFNFFVVLPEITASLGFGWVMRYLLHDNRLLAVVIGGVFLIIAAGLTLLIKPAPINNLSKEMETLETDEAITSKLTEISPLNEHQS